MYTTVPTQMETQSFRLEVNTGRKFYTEVFERRYTLVLDSINGSFFATLRSVDMVPSGAAQGGSRVTITQNIPVKLSDVTKDVNKFIARQALKYDKRLRQYNDPITDILSSFATGAR